MYSGAPSYLRVLSLLARRRVFDVLFIICLSHHLLADPPTCVCNGVYTLLPQSVSDSQASVESMNSQTSFSPPRRASRRGFFPRGSLAANEADKLPRANSSFVSHDDGSCNLSLKTANVLEFLWYVGDILIFPRIFVTTKLITIDNRWNIENKFFTIWNITQRYLQIESEKRLKITSGFKCFDSVFDLSLTTYIVILCWLMVHMMVWFELRKLIDLTIAVIIQFPSGHTLANVMSSSRHLDLKKSEKGFRKKTIPGKH